MSMVGKRSDWWLRKGGVAGEEALRTMGAWRGEGGIAGGWEWGARKKWKMDQ